MTQLWIVHLASRSEPSRMYSYPAFCEYLTNGETYNTQQLNIFFVLVKVAYSAIETHSSYLIKPCVMSFSLTGIRTDAWPFCTAVSL